MSYPLVTVALLLSCVMPVWGECCFPLLQSLFLNVSSLPLIWRLLQALPRHSSVGCGKIRRLARQEHYLD